MENSSFITDAEFNNYINDSYAELYDLLTASFEDYFVADPVSFTLSSTNTYPLPATFYKLRGLDFKLSDTDWAEVKEFNFAERNRYRSDLACTRRYRIMGQKLYVLPETASSGTYQLWMIPRFTPLASDTDVMGDVLDFAEYVVIDAAIKALIKEESDISALAMQKQAMTDRVITMAARRDVDQPERIADVTQHIHYFRGR